MDKNWLCCALLADLLKLVKSLDRIDVCEVEEQEEDDDGDNETMLVPVVGFLFRSVLFESLTGDEAKLLVLMLMLFVGFGDCAGDGARLDKY